MPGVDQALKKLEKS